MLLSGREFIFAKAFLSCKLDCATKMGFSLFCSDLTQQGFQFVGNVV